MRFLVRTVGIRYRALALLRFGPGLGADGLSMC
jgi:hypothetical protein